jgi:hypothetical protein
MRRFIKTVVEKAVRFFLGETVCEATAEAYPG